MASVTRLTAAYLALIISLLACSLARGTVSSPTLPPPTPTRPMASSTPLPQPTATAPTLPEGASPIDDPAVEYHFYPAPEGLPAGGLLLYLDPERPEVRYLTWDGQTGPLLRIDVLLESSRELLEMGESTFAVIRARGNPRHLVIRPLTEVISRPGLDRPNAQIFTIFDIVEQEARGFNAACGVDAFAGRAVVGPVYLTYECSNYEGTIAFVPLDDPAGAFGRILPESVSGFYSPLWLSADELLITDHLLDGSAYCLAHPVEWLPVCGEVPYSIMGVSPDGEFIEVRDDRFRPMRVGLLETTCLRNPRAECEPTWTQAEAVIGWSGGTRLVLEAAAWAPDGAGYVVLNGDGPPNPNEPTTAWYFENSTGELRELATMSVESISVPTAYGDVEGNGVPSSFWSPDGEWLLLQAGDLFWWQPRPLYLISRETGVLRLLLEDAGQVVGELTLP